MSESTWGYHLILDCRACTGASDAENIWAFVAELVPSIDMQAWGDPVVQHFAEHSPAHAGYSLVQLVETSSITGHFADETGDAYLDIFSCKAFDTEIVKRVVRAYFKPERIRTTFLHRQA